MAAGREAFDDGRFEEAANHFRAALRAGARSNDEEAFIRCRLTETLEKRRLVDEQFEILAKYEKPVELARLSEKARMTVLIRLGWAYSLSSDTPRAIALFNQAMEIARKLDDASAIGACHFGLGRTYRFVSEIRIARDHYASALEYFRKVGNWRDLADCYFCIGNIDAREGDFRTALNSVKQALTIVGDRNEHDLLGRAYLDMGMLYENVGASYEKVIASHEKAAEHFRAAGNSYYLAVNYNNLAMRLVWLGQWERAESLVKEAIAELRMADASESETMMHALAATLDTLALICLLRGRLDEADRLLEESLQIFHELRNRKETLRKEHPNEAETRLTVGRTYIVKGQPDEAIKQFSRALDISVRLGDKQFLSETRLWLAEALLQTGDIGAARAQVEVTREFLRDMPDMPAWGLLMRTVAKLEAADGHLASAFQSLGQSTSVFRMRNFAFDLAINRIVLAELMQRQGRTREAISEVESALAELERLGAAIEAQKARAYLELLSKQQPENGLIDAEPRRATPDLASVLDGFMAQRLAQAAVSSDLLLYELAAIANEQAASRAAIVVEVLNDDNVSKGPINLKLVASVGLDESEQAAAMNFLSRLEPGERAKHHVYQLTDNHQSKYLLRIIEPRTSRFLAGAVSIQPLLSLATQALELCALKSRHRRTQVFDPARLLSQVEIPGFICASRAMSHVLEQIHKIRSSDVTVLITGESGTGKELIARAVHAGSSRRANTFLPFNCSAAPRDMIESQLFGYRKGAFTGAVADNPGIIRAAERGTLFLDEIGDLPIELQPKLLRFLQEGEIHPIGESQPLRVDVRVVAATNSNLERAVAEGKFREDLFHRLNVIRIQVPPLRQRREEIPALINHYLNEYQHESAKSEIKISEEALDLMVVYDWPGNVRQLCNEVRRLVAYSDSGTIITPADLSPEIAHASHELEPVPATSTNIGSFHITPTASTTLAEAMEELERRMIQDALRRSSGNIARAAKELGLSRKGLYLKMDRLNFNV